MKKTLRSLRKNMSSLLSFAVASMGVIGVLLFSQMFASAALSVESSLSGDKSKLAPGEQFQYIVTVENKGDEELHNVLVKPTLSDKIEYIPGSTTKENNGETKAVVDDWLNTATNLGNIAPTKKGYVRFSAKIKSDTAVGTNVVSQAEIWSDEMTEHQQRGYSVEVVSGDQTTTLQATMEVNDNTLQGPRVKSLNIDAKHVAEFFTVITNTGESDARNVHVRIKFEPDFKKVMTPVFEVTANNAPTTTDTVTVTANVDSILAYKLSFARLRGISYGDSAKNCPEDCEVPDVFHVYPYNIGDIKPGETLYMQLKFKADVVPREGTAPKCDSLCSSNNDCLSAHVCYKADGAEQGNCRLESNKPSASCTPKEEAPKCDSVCSSNSECPSNLFCYKTSNNAEKGNCRRVDNEKNSFCKPPKDKEKECNSTCSSNSDCPSNLFCHKQSGQNSGLCRRESNPSSMTCETSNEGGFIVMKYRDDNSNASRDSEEKGLSWSFQWDLNGDNNWRDYVTSDETNGEGGRVGGLKDGDKVRIREIGKSGWVATTSTEVSIEIEEGQTKTARFGNRPTQPTVTTQEPPKGLPKTGVDIVAQALGSVGVGAFGLYLRRRKTV